MNVGLFQVQIFSRVSLKKVAFSSLALSQADCFRSSTRFQAGSGYSLLSQSEVFAPGGVICRWQAQQRPDPPGSDARTSAHSGRYFPAHLFG